MDMMCVTFHLRFCHNRLSRPTPKLRDHYKYILLIGDPIPRGNTTKIGGKPDLAIGYGFYAFVGVRIMDVCESRSSHQQKKS
jgi:hypothetical protein